MFKTSCVAKAGVNDLGLVPTSDITIIIIIINGVYIAYICLSGNAENHNHKDTYDRHNRKKMIEYFLMIMLMS